MKKKRRKKPKGTPSSSAGTISAPKIEEKSAQNLQLHPTPETEQHREQSQRFGVGAALTLAAALVTIFLGGPPFFDEYDKTFPAVELYGDINDPAHPFNVPLIIKDRSTIFDMHNVKVTCEFDLVWILDGRKAPAHGIDSHIYSTTLIAPQTPFVFTSELAGSIEIRREQTGELAPIERGLLVVKITYDTQLASVWGHSLNLPRVMSAYFNVEPSAKGLRWIPGTRLH